jgi:uncharacterized protein
MGEDRGVALITGASAGIGREFAKVFAEHGHELVVVARRKARLESLARELHEEFGATVHVVPIDLSERDSARRVFEIVTEQGLEIEILVNNAAMMRVDLFHEAQLDDQLAVIQLNVLSLAALTHLFLAPMVVRGSGKILNLASLVSFLPTPSFAAYGASKAFILSFTQALSQELKGTGVTATALCPGYTETDMMRGFFEASGGETLKSLLPAFVKIGPAKVAREGYKACMRGKAVHIDRLLNKILVQCIRLQPLWLVRSLSARMARFGS